VLYTIAVILLILVGFIKAAVSYDIAEAVDATIRRRIWRRFALPVTAAAILCASRPCVAQGQPQADAGPSYPGQIAKRTLLDPTSYAPATLLYISSRLDWSSSQQFFQNGSLENNARYTVSGLPVGVPISDVAGQAQILHDSLEILPLSFANNALTVVLQRALTHLDPEHRRQWVALAWIERVVFACTLSYTLSARHFQQWQQNERMAVRLGY
jgi:hypothetical protein